MDLRRRPDSIILALDRESVRTKIEDDSGELWRLEVANAHISKAAVNPYLGREIPNAMDLGLEPDKVYQLLRHPDELQKAAPTANMLPLLRKHAPVSADDHQPYDVIGATGSSANFDGKYLNNALSIWTREGVEAVESGRQKELSCGYSYRAEMTSGNFDGTEFDGVMRDLRFNHLALVEDGRAGPDVVVGDSNQEIEMADNREIAKKLAALSARQVSVGAILTYLKPRMALDAKAPIMATIFGDVTGKKLAEQRPAIAARIRELAKGKLRKNKIGQDASLDDVEKVLEMLNEHDVGGGEGGDESVSKEQHNAMEAAAHGASELDIPEKVGKEFAEADKGKSFDAEAVGKFLREKGMGEDDVSTALGMMTPTAATDEDPEEKKKREDEEAKKAEAGKAEDKKAMDAAVKLAVDAASKAIREGLMKTQQEIRAAEAEVRPYVGELPVTMTFDSAAAIKRHALGILKVAGADTVHEDALSAILAAQPKPGEQRRQDEQRQSIGMDAATTKSFHERFPGSANIRAA